MNNEFKPLSPERKEQLWQNWVASRPLVVQLLIKEFPVGTTTEINGVKMHLTGWTEDDFLTFSHIDPSVDYEGAVKTRVHICAKHLREQKA